jgi:hypothetical protein
MGQGRLHRLEKLLGWPKEMIDWSTNGGNLKTADHGWQLQRAGSTEGKGFFPSSGRESGKSHSSFDSHLRVNPAAGSAEVKVTPPGWGLSNPTNSINFSLGHPLPPQPSPAIASAMSYQP